MPRKSALNTDGFNAFTKRNHIGSSEGIERILGHLFSSQGTGETASDDIAGRTKNCREMEVIDSSKGTR
ncbi:hypothetical protein Pmar_PMAR006670 [Perkinsus marinus ATCC 50983]|uniref:Uncharacterized protein n=1 Tax=Perkinsus marinus (strain ATCC 50983 / TXsc) TaxID=423536 RepID=C5LLX6_PERM5|nr:hypothetical protein Pmar_PMAR006670 [Perkinsus marinus ATCC 50983]EER02348.1 hypothetical protein Pmar_PMAR006670 [Perkinsus marinus ATCC 50983]|eukprot:XP_002769630.1 hypothetical protein Pmar_PMAR006670 [Perkinsus marinus ATCC 50983]